MEPYEHHRHREFAKSAGYAGAADGQLLVTEEDHQPHEPQKLTSKTNTGILLTVTAVAVVDCCQRAALAAFTEKRQNRGLAGGQTVVTKRRVTNAGDGHSGDWLRRVA